MSEQIYYPQLGKTATGMFYIITAAFLFVCLAKGPFPKSSGDVRALMPLKSQGLTDLTRMETIFGANLLDSIVVAIPKELDDDTREYLTSFADELSELPGIRRVFSPVEGYSSMGFPVRLVNESRTAGRYLFEIGSELTDSERRALDESLNALVSKHSKLSPLRSGVFSLSEAATRNVQQENGKWTPVCVAALFLCLLFVLRDWRTSIVVFLPPFITLIWVVGALLLFGIELSPVSELVLPLLLIIGASYSTFVIARLVHSRVADDPESLQGLPLSIALAVSTTVAGFVALLVLDVRGVVQFGILMSLGTILSGAIGLYLPRAMLSSNEDRLKRLEQSIGRFSFGRNFWFGTKSAAILAGVSLIFASGILSIKVDTSPFDFLPVQSEEYKNFRTAAGIFPGAHALAIVFERASNAPAFTESDIRVLDTFAVKLRSRSEIAWTISAGDFLRFHGELEKRGLEADSALRFGPASITTPEQRATRIIVETDSDGASLIALELELEQEMRNSLPAEFLTSVRGYISSRELVISHSSLGLSRGLLLSVVTALCLVSALLFLVFRDIRFAFYGAMPSLIPILFAFGAVGFAMPTVNRGAAMVAAVALGLISDNTFHYVVAFRTARRRLGHREAASYAFDMSCGAFVSTAIVLVIGFLPTTFSQVLPIRQFGIFLSGSLLLGLGMNALLLPAMIESIPWNFLQSSEGLAENDGEYDGHSPGK